MRRRDHSYRAGAAGRSHRVATASAVVAVACAVVAVPTGPVAAGLGTRPTARSTAATTLTMTTTLTTATTSTTTASVSDLDPAAWSDGRLGAQLVFVCLDAAATSTQRTLSEQGIGGITLLGNDAPADLASRLASVRAAAPHGLAPMVASDEEGGLVQRLAGIIYPLPSAQTMGTWSTSRIRSTAYQYAQRMRAIGVPMDFAPVADLGISGYYMDSLHRAFSRWPKHVGADVTAWVQGMRDARVLTTVKHWPGEGQASNTHTEASSVPPLSTLETRDMVPFRSAFAAGVPAVMVGHVTSTGLTDPGWPASESPRALGYLRAHVGQEKLIVTDALSMAAASSAVGLTVPQAVVRALRSGADVALTCSSRGVLSAVTHALDTGALAKSRAVASARRLLALKAREGLVQGYAGPLPTTIHVHVAAAAVPVGGADTISATVRGPYRKVSVQEYRSGAWHTIRWAVTGPHAWFRVSLPTKAAGTYRFRVHARFAFPYAKASSSAVTVKVTS